MSEYPAEFDLKGTRVTLRPFAPADLMALQDFAQAMPLHDLLFLDADIQKPEVLVEWAKAVIDGQIISLVAFDGPRVVGTAAIVRDRLGWSQHVAEMHLLVAEDYRGLGLGRTLLHHAFTMAVDGGAEKLCARMTPDQKGAISMFEEMGFRQEALLTDHVRERGGDVHDLAVYSYNVGRIGARHGADGFVGLYPDHD